MSEPESWGRYPKAQNQTLFYPASSPAVPDAMQSAGKKILPRGLGRSYGDSCLNSDGILLSTARLNKFISFNFLTGVLRAEAGVSLDDILQLFVPRGWFLPVTSGTKFVTLGGAIANDIHGKNHHHAGNFSHHLTAFELLRSDGSLRICSPTENAEWFYATIGGLGLTGFITWAELKLKPVAGPYIDVELIKFRGLEEFAALTEESKPFEYTVSWLDCASSGKNFARGIFMRGTHAERREPNPKKILHHTSSLKRFPFDAPAFLINPLTVQTFNFLYYHRLFTKRTAAVQHYDPYFYPLDAVLEWNRVYGKRGFLQWQCVVPKPESKTDKSEVVHEIIERIAKSKMSSPLVVFKAFGEIPSLGMMSFPKAGLTLAIDFPNLGQPLYKLLDELDELVIASGGRIYPAKDGRMSGKTFEASFPRLPEFSAYIDPKFSSDFFRRVTAGSRLMNQTSASLAIAP